MYSGEPVLVRATLSYVGTRFAGWQRQANALAVQQVVEEAIASLTGELVATAAAGRTDAGVHARGQVVSFRLTRPFPLERIVGGVNHYLPEEIRLLEAAVASDGFNARRSALAKEYRYRLFRGRVVPADRAPFVANVDGMLEIPALRAASRTLIGEHDFAAFALTGGVEGSTIRRMFAAGWEEEGPELLFCVTGEGFLRGMVRSLVGTMIEVGRGRRTPEEFAALLDRGSRAEAGPTAPARGLVLERVDYRATPAPGKPATVG